MLQVVNVFSTGFWRNGCEQILNSHFTAEASLACAAGDFKFFVKRDGHWCLRDFSAFFYLISDPQKRGVYVTFVWWWILVTVWESVCLNKYTCFETWKERVFLIKRYRELWHLSTWRYVQMSIQMSANVDVECRQGSLQMLMEISKMYVKKCQCQAPEDDAQNKKCGDLKMI